MRTAVAVADLRPNPFRHLERYPIDRDKVEALKTSIRDTSFWDNLVCRKQGSVFELAYGHHRKIALDELGIKEIDIPVRDLTDDDMAKIMSHENMVEWSHSSAVEQETVRAIVEGYADGRLNLPKPGPRTSKNHLRYAPKFSAGADPSSTSGKHPYAVEGLAEYLGWKPYKVESALDALALVEQGLASEEDFEGLSTKQAQTVAAETRRAQRETGKPELAKAVGSRLAAGMKKSVGGTDRSGHRRNVKEVTIHTAKQATDQMISKHRVASRPKKIPDINRFADDMVRALKGLFPPPTLKQKLDQLIEFKQHLGSKERRQVVAALRALANSVSSYANALER